MRRIFSFDLDGVVVEGTHLAIMDRMPERYKALSALPGAIAALNQLSFDAEVYFTSSRSCRDATYLSRQWLEQRGLEMDRIAGVLCNVVPSKKALIVKELFATYHFDDDPYIISTMPDHGVLVRCADTLGNLEANPSRVAEDWRDIMRYCYNAPPVHIAYAPQQSSLMFAV